MKGIINKGIQEMVESQFGADTWEKVRVLAGCDDLLFTAAADYPDTLTFALAEAVSAVCNLPLDTVLVEFGKYWITHTGAQSYPVFFKLAGTNARKFLLNMDWIHREATRSIPNAHPPRFTYESQSNGQLLMHYHSERRLCAVLRGLILGVGLHFNEPLTVIERACMKEGAPRCTMEVTFG